ncbi:MAG: hypothetical protein Q8N77_02560 [Nanoarchaeota archaeon]|nr:hypothetical protein [Nanoarchaeota archaeon]
MKKLLFLLAVIVLLVSSVTAATLSVQLKRTNPGIAGEKAATLIYDVVNMDTEHLVRGFIVCQSPDDVLVTSSYGAGTGTGAQYVSPFLTMDKGPYQSSMTLTVESDSVGDKQAGCIFKYIPYKEVAEGSAETVKEPVEATATVTSSGKDVSGFLISMTEYTAAVADDTATADVNEAVPAKAKIKVNDEVKELEVGSKATIKGIEVTLSSASADGAEISVKGEKTVTISGETKQIYQKMNGEYITELKDMYYRELRMDKSVPFVADMSDPTCPEGKETCKASEVIDIGGMKIPTWAIIVGALLVILLIAYLLGKTSRS